MDRSTKRSRAKGEVREPKAQELTYAVSSGNVFEDLGLENPQDLLQKSRLVSLIGSVIQSREWTQSKAAAVMGIAQPDLSKLLKGHIAGFSLDRLLSMLLALGVSVRIQYQVPEELSFPGKLTVEAAPLAG